MAYRGHAKANSRADVAIETFPRHAIPGNLRLMHQTRHANSCCETAFFRLIGTPFSSNLTCLTNDGEVSDNEVDR